MTKTQWAMGAVVCLWTSGYLAGQSQVLGAVSFLGAFVVCIYQSSAAEK